MVVVERPPWWPTDPATEQRVVDAMGPLRLRWSPWTPTVKQDAALRVMARELFYGGAAGGGKSAWMLMAAAQFVDVPGYRALILRRTYPELAQPDGLIDVAHRWWDGTGARWNESAKRWTFPSGARIYFGHMQTATAHMRYQGGGYHFVGYEEATHFEETQYLYLHSRTRRPRYDEANRLPASADGLTAATVPIRMRATANPGGPGHEWCKTRFVDEKTREPGVVYIKAMLSDNPHLDAEDYVQSLAHLDAVTRMQLLEGNWDVRPDGTLIMAGWFQYLDETHRGVRYARAWDLAASKPIPGVNPDPSWTVGTRMLRTKEGAFEIDDVIAFREDPGTVENRVKAAARRDGRGVVIGIPKDPAAAGKTVLEHYKKLLRGFTVYGMPTSKDKAKRAEPFIAAVSNQLVWVKRAPWTTTLVRELSGFPFTGHDDHLDSCADAHTLAASAGPVRVKVATGSVATPRGRRR